jgi:transcriptional regulator with PAS, ATPase and Fis domain
MLRKETVENLKNVFLKQNENNPYVIHFLQIDQDFYSVQYEIGRFNFYTNEGYIVLPKIGKKEYKRFGSLMNAIFKIDEFFGWDASVVENAKKAAQNLKEEEKKRLELEYKEHQEQKAKNFIESINNNDEKTINIIKNKLMYKTEEEVKQIVKNSFKDVSSKTIEEVTKVIMHKINKLNNQFETEEETSNNKHFNNNDTYYFNSYDPLILSKVEWSKDINKHHAIYNNLIKYKHNVSNILPYDKLYYLLKNNYNHWIKIINIDPRFYNNTVLIELNLLYINKPILFYINTNELYKYITVTNNNEQYAI